MNALVLAVAMLSGTADAGRGAPDVWISIDQEVLAAFDRGGEAWEATPMLPGDMAAPRPQVVATAMPESRIDELVRFIHERYRRCGGFIAHGSREEALYAASQAAYSEVIERLPPPVPYTIDNGLVAKMMVREVQEPQIRQTITDLSAFFTRWHNCPTGRDSALSIRDKWLAYAAGRSDVTVELFNHTGYTTQQPSVILTIQGTTLPTEVVVMGGHQDSRAGSSCGRAPGADDDASGIAVVSEIIRVAMATDFQPQRTVKFMAYAAEEDGIRGSNQIAQAYVNQGINVIGVMQFDMTNYSDTPQHDIVLFNDFTNVAQNAFVANLMDVYVPSATVIVPRVTSQCGYGCSDHASWHSRGFPASFPFEARFGDHSPFLHTSNDTLDQSGNHALRSVPFAQLGLAYVAELAKGGFTARPERAQPDDATSQVRKTRVKAARSGRKVVAR